MAAAARPTGKWVHVFEEDTGAGAVFKPEDADIPLSRRPRQRLELRADGSALIGMPGPDDRSVPEPASWADEGGQIVVRDAAGTIRLRIVARSPGRLVAQRSPRS